MPGQCRGVDIHFQYAAHWHELGFGSGRLRMAAEMVARNVTAVIRSLPSPPNSLCRNGRVVRQVALASMLKKK